MGEKLYSVWQLEALSLHCCIIKRGSFLKIPMKAVRRDTVCYGKIFTLFISWATLSLHQATLPNLYLREELAHHQVTGHTGHFKLIDFNFFQMKSCTQVIVNVFIKAFFCIFDILSETRYFLMGLFIFCADSSRIYLWRFYFFSASARN